MCLLPAARLDRFSDLKALLAVLCFQFWIHALEQALTPPGNILSTNRRLEAKLAGDWGEAEGNVRCWHHDESL
jgi:hypothetical protein